MADQTREEIIRECAMRCRTVANRGERGAVAKDCEKAILAMIKPVEGHEYDPTPMLPHRGYAR